MNDFLIHLQSIKQEYSQLYSEVHEFTDAIPELNNMVSAVQAMGKFVSLLIFFFKKIDMNRYI